MLALVAAAVATGCGRNRAGVQRDAGAVATGDSAPDSGLRVFAVDHYTAGRYGAAKAAAASEHKAARSTREREAAALTAGLSAHALNQNAEAERWLEPLTKSEDPQIAGRAEATLGLIAQRQNQHVMAAGHLDRASKRLTGDDAARAAMQAGHSLTALGRHEEAHDRYVAATGLAGTDRVRESMQAYAEPGPFALQVGVFASKPNADKQARQLGLQTSSLGLGTPVVAAGAGKGGFAVRVGSFPSRQAAVLAKDRLGTQAVIVSAVQ